MENTDNQAPLPQAETKPIRPLDTLAFTKEDSPESRLKSSKLIAAKARAQSLEEIRTKNSTFRETLNEIANKKPEKKFTTIDAENLKLKFGAGEAKKEEKTIKEPSGEKENAIFNEANISITSLSKFIEYSKILLESKDQKSLDKTLGEKGIHKTEFHKLRAEVLDEIINNSPIKEMLSEIDIPLEDKRNYIEATLLRDPKILAQVENQMSEINSEAENLPERPKNPEVEEANKTKELSAQKREESLEKISKELIDLGIEDTEELKISIQKFISEGRGLEMTMSYLKASLLNEEKIPAIKEISEYLSEREEYVRRWDKLSSIDKSKVDDELMKGAVEKVKESSKIVAAFENKLRGSEDLQKQVALYDKLIRLTTLQKDVSSPLYLSPIAEELNDIKRSYTDEKNADKIIREKGGDVEKNEKEWRVNRLVKESALVEKIKNVLPSSISKVLLDRYDEMEELEKQRQGQLVEEARVKGEENLANAHEKAGKIITESYIYKNKESRKREVNKDNIREDILTCAYANSREEALKMIFSKRIYNKEFSTLSEEEKNIINSVYEKQGEVLESRLFGDYFMAKGFLDQGFKGKLYLKKDELKYLYQNFGEKFTEKIGKTEEGQKALKELENKGITKKKGLFFFLAFLASIGMGAKDFING